MGVVTSTGLGRNALQASLQGRSTGRPELPTELDGNLTAYGKAISQLAADRTPTQTEVRQTLGRIGEPVTFRQNLKSTDDEPLAGLAVRGQD